MRWFVILILFSCNDEEMITLFAFKRTVVVPDLENAVITKSEHYRGHVASFTDCNDLLSSNNLAGMELIFCENNMGATMFANGNNSTNQDIYNFGRLDLGIISVTDAADWDDMNVLITAARSGNAPSVTSYKNGNDSYKDDLLTKTLYARNSKYEAVSQTLPTAYTGLTPTDLKSRGVTFRDDYYAKTTQADYYVGSQSLGDSRLATYVSTVLSANGWYTNFTHWHWQVADYPEHYLSQLLTNVGASDVYFGTFNTVAEYYFVKESVTSITAVNGPITVNHTKDWPDSPYSKIQTPLWVKVDITGTNLEGKDIVALNGLKIRKVSATIFYVPVMLNFDNASSTVQISSTFSPDYVNLNEPVINRTGNAVTSDQPCKFTIFRIQKPTSLATSSTSNAIPSADNTAFTFTVETGLTIAARTTIKVNYDATNWFYATVTSYNSGTGELIVSSSSSTGSGTYSSWTIQRYYHKITASIVERDFTLSTSYTIAATLDEVNYTYYVGGITEDKISAVI